MKKSITLQVGMVILIMMAACLPASAKNSKTLLKRATSEVAINGKSVAKIGKAPIASTKAINYTSTVKKWSDGSSEADLLIDEDFSAFKAGTEDKPDSTMLANYYGAPGMYIDDALTSQDTWAGCFVYSAGGKVALISPNEYTGADLDTPLGDYSGDLTITFKVKALVNSDLFVNLLTGGYDIADDANTKDESNSSSYRLYAGKGWTLITLKVSNYSADNDGFIQFHNYGSIVIDDFTVTTTSNFIASPKILPVTNFNKTGFTANWEPVRKAFNYRVDLYKKVLTSANDTTFTANFENSNASGQILPPDWTLIQHGTEKIGEKEGSDSTKALILVNGDTIATPFDLAKIKDASLWMHLYDPDPDNNYDVYNTTINLDVRTLSGWENLAEFTPDGFFDGRSINLTKTIKSNKYYAIRIRVDNLPKGDYVALDDINVTTGAPARLDTIEGDFPGEYYATTKNCYYTFTGLDSIADYFYTVKAHYIMQYSEPELQFAFGVTAPDLLPATDITATSYTANWSAAPKATRYLVNNYGVFTATKDITGNTVLTEDFSGVNSEATTSTDPYNPEEVGNDDAISLDSYMKNTGWTGAGTTLCQGMIGAAQGSSVGATYVKSAPMYLDNADNFSIKIKAYGTTGEALVLKTNNKKYAIYFESSDNSKNGTIDNTYIIPDRSKTQEIYFYTAGSTAFMLDDIAVSQDIKKGSKVYTLLSSKEVTADSLKYNFGGLDKYTYEGYAYALTSYYDLDGETAESTMNGYQPVTLLGASGINNVTSNEAAVKEVARYNLSGIKLPAPVPGLNIVKYSNGKVAKVFVKE